MQGHYRHCDIAGKQSAGRPELSGRPALGGRDRSPGDLPLYADNDARTALIAEVLWGAARGKRNVVLLTLGTGVGGAALVDGTILRGASGAAGHLGHMTLDLHGGLCICGNRGCVETRFSSRAIESDYLAHLHRAAPTKLSLGKAGEPPTTEAIFRAAAEGDESARCVIDRALEYLTAAVVSVLHIFDPEVLIIGGNIAEAGPQLLAPIRDEVAQAHPDFVGTRDSYRISEPGRLRWSGRRGWAGIPAAGIAENLIRGPRFYA